MQAAGVATGRRVGALLKRAEEIGAAEDARFAPDVGRHEVPEKLRPREDRLGTIGVNATSPILIRTTRRTPMARSSGPRMHKPSSTLTARLLPPPIPPR